MKCIFLSLLLVPFALTGCAARSGVAVAPPVKGASLPARAQSKPASHTDQVDIAGLQPAQGHLAPGMLVYSKEGFLDGRVVKIDPNHTWPHGARGAVLFSWNDNPKAHPQYVPFETFDKLFVLKK